MGHIIGAEFLWLARIQGRQSELSVWPDLTLDECEARCRELSSGLAEALLLIHPLIHPSKIRSEPVSYTNSKGEPWTSTVEDILTHLVIHSAYHRGQIASDLRTAGHEPAYTDYIHAVRQRLLE